MATLQTVLISGANQGLGYQAALQLSKVPGWQILLGSRDAERGKDAVNKINEEGPASKVDLMVLDVTSEDSVLRARKEIEEKYGSKLDVLVVSYTFHVPDKVRIY
jgi:NAD(P)-dependent dehydrogenase (short-subunit alcohol dehydrogenase family)